MTELVGKKKRTRSQIGKASRNKGKVMERRIANILKDRGFEARRAVQFDGLFSHDIHTDLPFNFEAKAVENLNINNAMEQARTDSRRDGTTPTVVHKKNGKPLLITMDFTDFIDFMQFAVGYVDDKNAMDLREIRVKYTEKMRSELEAEELL